MNLTEGQSLALSQLRSIESESENDFEIIYLGEWQKSPDYCEINISINLRCFAKKLAGFPFRPRERFKILVHKEFPYQLPSISFIDTRYSGRPHVQWGKVICLYQSVDIDYDPADGMFGIMQRLDLWLEKAALGDLDPFDAPLHPPVAYIINEDTKIVIPNVNTPDFQEEYWLENCAIEELNSKSLIISQWTESNSLNQNKFYGAVLLMNNVMPFEYPYTLDQLLRILDSNKINLKSFLELLGKTALHNGKGTDLYIIIGAAMRGLQNERKQHLAVWCLEEKLARSIRSIFNTPIKSNKTKQRVHTHFEKLEKFSTKSKLDWCKVLDNRSEIVLGRDKDTYSNFFKDKIIEIWGCGALGSHIAEIITRAKPKKIILYDEGIVKPGLLVRQLFTESDIGTNKAVALKSRIGSIYSKLANVEVESHNKDILVHMNEISPDDKIDIIIDTTASLRVFRKIDQCFIANKIKIPFISLTINNTARKAMVIYKSPTYNSGVMDIIRKSKIKLCEKNDKRWIMDFFPDKLNLPKLIQPEPGCSDPTFIGSEADLSALSGLLTNQALKGLMSESEKSKVIFTSQELDAIDQVNIETFNIENYSDNQIFLDPINGYKILVPTTVLGKIKEVIKKSDKKHNPPYETGGLIFGEWDDLSKIVYLNDISAAPEDSKSAPNHFECGIEGTNELNYSLKTKYRNSVYFVGLWHSHPFGSAKFSGEDKASMQLVVTKLSPPKSLLLIIAYNKDNFSVGGFVFNKSQFKN